MAADENLISQNSDAHPLEFDEAESALTPVEVLGMDGAQGGGVDPKNPDDTPDNLDEVIPPHTPQALPVVGLGGSAGAIPALREFFSLMPPDSGMAFVVVIHLMPDFESTLPEILQAHTAMPVMGVTETTKLEANHVYVISPNVHLSLMDGQILTEPLVPEYGRRVAVDLFFRTLADTHGTNATGIVLSGADSDGVIGLKRIKERGGLTVAQLPDEAEYDSMPRSVIATGMVDWILRVGDMPSRLLTHVSNEKVLRLPPEALAAQNGNPEKDTSEKDKPGPNKQKRRKPQSDEATQLEDENALREVLAFLRARTGHDFAHYKRATILRRIGRRLQVNSLPDIPSYINFLRTNPGEASALLHDLLISVTNFFRDPESFRALEAEIPKLFKDKGRSDEVRVWVAGCATGEEAYSVAMLLAEYSSKLNNAPSILVLATDLSDSAIHSARNGVYPPTIEADVSPERLRRYFSFDGACYRVRRELRETILFAPHNLLKDSPFSRLDLVTCRNLLIYLNREAQTRAFETFHFSLKPDGLLFLGSSESVGDVVNLFEVHDKKHRLYIRRAAGHAVAPPIPLPGSRLIAPSPPSFHRGLSTHAAMEASVEVNGETVAPRRRGSTPGDLHLSILEKLAPPSVVINEDYEIVHLSESAGKFLQFSGGQPSTNLLQVVHPSLRLELGTVLFTATQLGQDVRIPGLPFDDHGTRKYCDLVIRPAPALSGAGSGMVVVLFEEFGQSKSTPVSPRTASVEHQLDEELQQIKSNLRSTVEQYGVSVEELKASNEELQAMNEEARSTAEELETSKEELQSVNEELTTVNQELSSKVEELSRANSDLNNLMAATDIATIFLDRELCIKRFTPRAAKIFNVIPSDIDRPLSHLSHKLEYSALSQDADSVLSNLAPVEKEIRTDDGEWLLTRVLPYRTGDDRIDGVVITLTDITEQKHAEFAVRAGEEQFRRSIEDAPIPIIMQAEDGEVLQISRSWTELTGYSLDDVPTIDAWLNHAYGEGADAVRTHIHELFDGTQRALNVEFVIQTRNKQERHWSFSASSPGTLHDGRRYIVGMAVDITERKLSEEALHDSEQHFRIAIDASGMGTWDWNITTGKILWNEQHYRLLGLEPDGESKNYKSFEEHIHPDDRARVRESIDVALNDDTPFVAEFRAVWPDQSVHWMSGYGRVIERENGRPTRMGGVMYDSTEHNRAEAALRESEERFRLLVEGTQDYAMFLMDADRKIVHWNIGAERVFGWTREEAIGQSADMIFTPEDIKAGAPEQEAQTAVREGRAIDRRWHLRKDGSRFWADGVMSCLGDESTLRGFVKIARDMTRERESEEELRHAHDEMEARVVERTTELAKANDQLRKHAKMLEQTEAKRQQLVQRLVMAQEEERKRISRELHDQMGQTLTALKVGLGTFAGENGDKNGDSNDKNAAQMKSLNTLLDNLVEQVHGLAWELRPALLDNFGLESALEHYVSEWSRQSNIAAAFASRGFSRTKHMAPPNETAFYRVVQEALTNVQRHSAATQVSVVLERVGNEVSAIIEDNGKGFKTGARRKSGKSDTSRQGKSTPATAPPIQRLGLVGMRERMELIGGSLTIESKSGKGTTVYARAPFERRSTPRDSR